RMTRATIHATEVDRERTIIASEREGMENWPGFLVAEELTHLAYKVHPYRWEPLGAPGDIAAMNADDLRSYYRRFYGPKNALLGGAGGFAGPAIEGTIRSRFGRLPGTGEDPTVRVVEPPLRAERRATVRGPGTTPLFVVGWHAPAVSDPAAPAAIALDLLL